MSLFKLYETQAKSKVSLWQIEEENANLISIASELNINLKKDYFKYEQNHNEYLSSRIALKNIDRDFILIDNEEKSAPKLYNSTCSVSISHCKKMSAAMSNYFKPVGIDCEVISPRILNVSKRFMNSIELDFIEKNKSNELILNYILWCCKESIFKKYYSLHLDYRRNIFIENFILSATGSINSTIKTEEVCIREKLFYTIYDDVVVVHTS